MPRRRQRLVKQRLVKQWPVKQRPRRIRPKALEARLTRQTRPDAALDAASTSGAPSAPPQQEAEVAADLEHSAATK